MSIVSETESRTDTSLTKRLLAAIFHLMSQTLKGNVSTSRT